MVTAECLSQAPDDDDVWSVDGDEHHRLIAALLSGDNQDSTEAEARQTAGSLRPESEQRDKQPSPERRADGEERKTAKSKPKKGSAGKRSKRTKTKGRASGKEEKAAESKPKQARAGKRSKAKNSSRDVPARAAIAEPQDSQAGAVPAPASPAVADSKVRGDAI